LKIAQAFRVAFRQANLREDLPQVPRLIVHRAVWMPLLAAVASLAVFVATGPKNNLTYFAFQTFVLPPSMATLFIAGFFVPTAAYLMGGIVGTATAVLYCVFVALASQGLVPDVAADSVEISQQIGFAFSIGPVSGVVLGAAAAWYRRFLYLSSPARPGAAGRPGASGNRRPRGASGRTGTRGR